MSVSDQKFSIHRDARCRGNSPGKELALIVSACLFLLGMQGHRNKKIRQIRRVLLKFRPEELPKSKSQFLGILVFHCVEDVLNGASAFKDEQTFCVSDRHADR